MKFLCDNCQAQYMIADEKVGPAGVRVRCKKCSHVIFVKKVENDAPTEDSTVVVSKEKMAQLSTSSAVVEADPSPAADPFPAAPPADPPLVPDAAQAPAPVQATAGLEDEIGQALDSMFSDTKPAAAEPPAPSSSGGSRPPVVLGPSPLSRAPGSPFAALDARQDAMLNFEAPELTQIASPALAGGGPPAAAASKASEWFIAIQDEQVGPLKVAEIKERFEKGEVSSDTLVWATGQSDWRPLSSVEELAELVSPKKEIVRISRLPIPPEPAKEPQKKKEPIAFRPSAASALASLASMAKEENDATEKSSSLPPTPRASGSLPPQLPAGLPTFSPSSDAIPVAEAPQEQDKEDRAPSASLADYRNSPLAQTKPRRKGGRRAVTLVAGGLGLVVVLAGIAATTYAFVIKPQRDFEARVEQQQHEEAQRQKEAEKARLDALAAAQAAALAAQKTPPTAPPAPTVTAQAPPAAPTAPAAQAMPQPIVRAPPPEPAHQESARDKRNGKHGKAGRGSETAVAAATPSPTAPRTDKPPPAKGSDDFLAAGDVDKEFAKELEGNADNGKASAKHGPYIPPPPGQADLPVALSQSDIVTAVTQHREAFSKCVQEQKRRDPSSAGTVVMRWRIKPDGRSSDIGAKGEDYADSPLANCFKGQIGKLHFGAYRGSQMAPIEFPFSF